MQNSSSIGEIFARQDKAANFWVPIIAAARDLGQEELSRRASALNRQISLASAKNQNLKRVYDPLPALLTPSEFAILEKGMRQRAHVLSLTLEDLYGSQTLLQQGLIPPTSVFGAPYFLRSMHTASPLSSPRLNLYAADIIRTSAGQFKILKDHTGIIPGLGHALSLRRFVNGILPELFRINFLRSPKPPLELFIEHLQQRAQGKLIAVLSNDSENIKDFHYSFDEHDVFDDALLSRALGVFLVEPTDLAARNGSLHIKTLSGLLPVSHLIRGISGANIDPLEQGGRPGTGIAGAFGAIRSGTLTMLNAPGSALLESNQIAPHIPSLFEYFTNTPAHLPLFNQEMDDRPSRIPFLAKNGDLVGTEFYFRLFAWHDGAEWQILPCGLGLPFRSGEENSHLGVKDLWVLDNDEPHLISGIKQSDPPARQTFLAAAHLPSRLADNLFWLGRSVERLEAAVRLLMLAIPRLESGTSLPRDLAERSLLSRCLVQAGLLPNDVAGANISGRMLRQTLAGRQPIIGLLKEVERLVDASAERFSSSMLATVRFALRQALEIPTADEASLPSLLGFTATFAGIASENMSRDGGWLFLEMGRRLERGEILASMFSILLDGPAERLGPGMSLAIELADSVLSYELRYASAMSPRPVLAMLLSDQFNPRALAFQCQALGVCLERLGADNDALAVKTMLGDLTQLTDDGLEIHKTLSTLVTSFRGLSARMQRRFFALLPEAHTLEDDNLIETVQ